MIHRRIEMTTHRRPRSVKSLHQPITDQPQEANSFETSSLAQEFLVKSSVGPDGKAVVEKLPVEINHDVFDIYLVEAKG